MLDTRLVQAIQRNFNRVSLRFDVPWRELTSLGVGGWAPLVVEPHDDIVLGEFLRFARKEGVPLTVVGCGCNIAAPDGEFEGVVLRLGQPAFTNIRPSRHHVSAGAGARLYDLFVDSAHSGVSCPEAAALAGIPGSLGGAVLMNAGRFGACVGDLVEELSGLDADGEPWCARGSDLRWGYRHSGVPPGVVLTAAVLKLGRREPVEALAAIREMVAKGRGSYPKERSAGCFFRNPPSGKGAGALLDQCGCKGLSSGGAEISARHANFLVNNGDALESDVIALACAARRRVAERAGIYLDPEVVILSEESKRRLQASPRRLRTLVLGGGASNERAVSLESSAAVSKALREAGHFVTFQDVSSAEEVDPPEGAFDVVFPVLHGGFGEDGTLQRRLEARGLPFVGCGSAASAIVMDKIKTKEALASAGLPTPAYAVLPAGEEGFPAALRLPVIVKPPADGSTYGVTVVHAMSEWPAAIAEARRVGGGGDILVEEFVEAIETTVGVLDGKALEVVEIRYPGEIYDYDAKYLHERGETLYLCPPESLSPEAKERLMAIAERCYAVVGAKDMLRVDILVSRRTGEPTVIEMNSIPGFTGSSLLPKAAAAAGIPFIELCATLAMTAWRRAGGVF